MGCDQETPKGYRVTWLRSEMLREAMAYFTPRQNIVLRHLQNRLVASIASDVMRETMRDGRVHSSYGRARLYGYVRFSGQRVFVNILWVDFNGGPYPFDFRFDDLAHGRHVRIIEADIVREGRAWRFRQRYGEPVRWPGVRSEIENVHTAGDAYLQLLDRQSDCDGGIVCEDAISNELQEIDNQRDCQRLDEAIRIGHNIEAGDDVESPVAEKSPLIDELAAVFNRLVLHRSSIVSDTPFGRDDFASSCSDLRRIVGVLARRFGISEHVLERCIISVVNRSRRAPDRTNIYYSNGDLLAIIKSIDPARHHQARPNHADGFAREFGDWGRFAYWVGLGESALSVENSKQIYGLRKRQFILPRSAKYVKAAVYSEGLSS